MPVRNETEADIIERQCDSYCLGCGHSFEEHGGVGDHISATKCHKCKCEYFISSEDD
jgi:hypothetical protein